MRSPYPFSVKVRYTNRLPSGAKDGNALLPGSAVSSATPVPSALTIGHLRAGLHAVSGFQKQGMNAVSEERGEFADREDDPPTVGRPAADQRVPILIMEDYLRN
jgi:hypothetical protein